MTEACDGGGTGERDLVERLREAMTARDWCALGEALGLEPSPSPIPPGAAGAWGLQSGQVEQFDSLQVVAGEPGVTVLKLEAEIAYREFRRTAFDVDAHNAADCVVWWWLRRGQLELALVDRSDEDGRFVRRMSIDVDSPGTAQLEQWARLRMDDLIDEDVVDPGRAARRHVRDVLRQEPVTREFFDDFRSALELMVETVESGPESERDRHQVALATLLRLVFVYFLQQRGALAGDERFVLRQLRRARSDERDFYRTVLRPLFFGALNRRPHERSQQADRLGAIPFLNGGLFEPLAGELEYDELTWPDRVWSEVVEEFLERYRFAVDEGIGDDRTRAVAPEMLGKVFEGLMYEETRADSGSFYTPREVVETIVQRAIGNYLVESVDGLEERQARDLVAGRRSVSDDAVHAGAVEAVETLRLLDPAVGTGAFLLEALHAIERLYDVLGIEVADEAGEFERRRAIIHRHLFGVDIQETATRICELRLWLSLLAVMPGWTVEEMPPLPNLGHRVACGQSLLSPTDLREREAAGPTSGGPAMALTRQVDAAHRDEMREIQQSYVSAHGDEKVRLRRRMEELERQMQRRLLEARRDVLEERLEPYEQLENSEDLFGDDVELSAEQRRECDDIVERLQEVDEALDELDAGRQRSGGFSFAARFGPVLDRGGFDVVVTNPPWIRANRLDRSERSLLEARYRCFTTELWDDAPEMGINVPFGAQVDVASLFVERSLELLREGGEFAALLPSKLFRSLHGAGLRRLVAGHRVRAVHDFADSEQRLFDATVYPSILEVEKAGRRADAAGLRRERRSPRGREPRGGGGERPLELSIWRDGRKQRWSTELDELFALDGDPSEPWLTVPPEVGAVVRAVRDEACALGRVERLAPARGAMTGRNELFLKDEEACRELLGAEWRDWSRPAVSGRDVRACRVEPERRLLWPCDGRAEVRDSICGRLQEYFERHAEELRSRADHREGRPLWQLFRLKPGLTAPKVVWRDLAPKLEAALAEPEQIPLNTVYFIPCRNRVVARVLVGLFNSGVVRGVAYALGERARGGWRRHFAWVMRMLPIPERVVAWIRGDVDVEGGAGRLGRLVEWAREAERLEPGAEFDREVVGPLFGLDSGEVDLLCRWRSGRNETGERAA